MAVAADHVPELTRHPTGFRPISTTVSTSSGQWRVYDLSGTELSA